MDNMNCSCSCTGVLSKVNLMISRRCLSQKDFSNTARICFSGVFFTFKCKFNNSTFYYFIFNICYFNRISNTITICNIKVFSSEFCSIDYNLLIYCTGFNKLDRAIKITDGLYIIGAISSLGKTTFTLQIADHIAESGRDVIIFSLEMSRKELIDKSICRMIFSDWIKNQRTSDKERLKNELEIQTLNPGQIASPSALNISDEKLSQLETKTSKYFQTIAKRTSIYESVGNVGVTEIAERVTKYVYYSGNKPLVIIDYLQLLAPIDPHFTDKQNTDKNVLELKRLSRELEIPIIAISSLNRANYNESINMSAFKESGAIEYSSDVLLGLQLAGAGDKDFNVDMAKSQEPRQIELKILKNRRGKTGGSIKFEYYASRQFFRELER